MAVAVLKSLDQVTVTTAGTAVPITALNLDRVIAVFISCPTANTGAIQVGDLNVKATGTRNGVEVAKSTMLPIQYAGHYINMKDIFVDAVTSLDKVLISYLQLTT